MEKLTIRWENSYWTATLSDIVKWAKGPAYNEVMKQRKEAAKAYLTDAGIKTAMV